MRKYFFMAVLAMLCLGVNAQVKKDSTGVYTSVSLVKTPDRQSGEFYKDSKGVKYPIYISANGKYYIIRTSKNTGKQYKSYLKLE